jgi:hypothetical protein
MKLTVNCSWDDEARVWYVEDSNVPGLAAEAPTVEAMNTLLQSRIPELIQLNMPDFVTDPQRSSFFELIAHRQQSVALAC